MRNSFPFDLFLFRWQHVQGTTDPISFGPPTITSVELRPGASYPSEAAANKASYSQQYYLEEDVYYVVIKGNGTVAGLGPTNTSKHGSSFASGDWW